LPSPVVVSHEHRDNRRLPQILPDDCAVVAPSTFRVLTSTARPVPDAIDRFRKFKQAIARIIAGVKALL
jgi:hypothetical protein